MIKNFFRNVTGNRVVGFRTCFKINDNPYKVNYNSSINCMKKNFSNKREEIKNKANDPSDSLKDDFFYDKENIDKTSQNIISIQNNKKAMSKLKLNDDNSQPLVENEAYRELYRTFSLYVTEDLIKNLDEIKHNHKENDVEYRYGLPVKNNVPFTALVPKGEEEELPKTSTENLFSLLDLDKESSYESLVLKFQMEYNHGIYYIYI